jgi:exonuclease SbcD
VTARLRFVQISDVHLDSRLGGGGLRLPPEKAEQRRRELREVFAAAIDLARERAVDVVLAPGDLFDDEAVGQDTVAFVIDVLSRPPRIPVVIVPGNHDPYSLASPYAAEMRAARGLPPWPPHVRIVAATAFEAFRLPELPDVSFTAMGHDRNRPIEERLLGRPLPRLEAPLQILLFHGSRDHTAPAGKMVTLPFSDAELAAQGFHYAAIGHYHDYASIEAHGRILGCYSGCPAGRSLAETGKKVVLAGEVARDGGRPRVEIEPVRLDRREIGQVQVSVQGALHRDAFLERLSAAVAAAGFTRDDLVRVEVDGRLPRGIDPYIPPDFLADRHFHVVFDASRLRPDYDLAAYLARGTSSTEGRFVRDMKARIDAAADPDERRLLEAALYYGLDALIQKEVVPRYED